MQLTTINEVFEEFAAAFVGRVKGEGNIAFPRILRRAELNLSVDSLHELDSYLEVLHSHRHSLQEAEWGNTVLWGGAYLGEVIRRNAEAVLNWVDYDEFLRFHPHIRTVFPERTLPTCAFLCSDDDKMTMPLNKIARYIEEGSLNSTFYYALLECRSE